MEQVVIKEFPIDQLDYDLFHEDQLLINAINMFALGKTPEFKEENIAIIDNKCFGAFYTMN